jgi:hypothetical protein
MDEVINSTVSVHTDSRHQSREGITQLERKPDLLPFFLSSFPFGFVSDHMYPDAEDVSYKAITDSGLDSCRANTDSGRDAHAPCL